MQRVCVSWRWPHPQPPQAKRLAHPERSLALSFCIGVVSWLQGRQKVPHYFCTEQCKQQFVNYHNANKNTPRDVARRALEAMPLPSDVTDAMRLLRDEPFGIPSRQDATTRDRPIGGHNSYQQTTVQPEYRIHPDEEPPEDPLNLVYFAKAIRGPPHPFVPEPMYTRDTTTTSGVGSYTTTSMAKDSTGSGRRSSKKAAKLEANAAATGGRHAEVDEEAGRRFLDKLQKDVRVCCHPCV